MKVFVVFAIIFLAVCACRKNTSYELEKYLGRWELRSSSSFNGLTFFPAGNGNIIDLRGDSILYFKHDTLSIGFSYKAHQETAYFSENRKVLKITPLNYGPAPYEFFMEVFRDTLSLYPSTEIIDAGGSSYVRIQ